MRGRDIWQPVVKHSGYQTHFLYELAPLPPLPPGNGVFFSHGELFPCKMSNAECEMNVGGRRSEVIDFRLSPIGSFIFRSALFILHLSF
jgi:hypothetical protein